MTTVKVNASTSYNVIIGSGLITSIGALVKDCLGKCRTCIVTDDTVDALYGATVEASLHNSGIDFLKFVIPHGEASKSTQNLVELLEYLATNRITRSDAIIALGGGVVGDLAGFAAGIYLRGIKFVQIPTTLLAAVDSSVGGKTAVDLVAGKNLAGVFHQPSLVVCDPDTLNTLPKSTFADGCAEVIKYGVIHDLEFFNQLKNGIRDNIEFVIAECVKRKADIVQKDEFDNGCRQLLNLGHTVGHAIESCSNFEISHGSAVAIGMAVVMKIAVSLGICPQSDLDELIKILIENGLPVNCPFDAEQLANVASVDKKRLGDCVSFIVPHGIGNCKPIKIAAEDIRDFIAKGL